MIIFSSELLTIIASGFSREAIFAGFIDSVAVGHQEADLGGQVVGEPLAVGVSLAAVQAVLPVRLAFNMDHLSLAFACRKSLFLVI